MQNVLSFQGTVTNYPYLLGARVSRVVARTGSTVSMGIFIWDYRFLEKSRLDRVERGRARLPIKQDISETR